MILLTGTGHLLQVVTGSALLTDVHASWVDNSIAGGIVPGNTNSAITTAATTNVVGSPPAATQRNVQTLNVRNKDASPNAITVQHSDGTTTVELIKYTLGAGETLQYVDGEGWKVIDVNGFIKSGPASGGGGNTGTLSAGTTKATLGEIVFSNSNGLSFGIDGQTVTGSYTVPSLAGLLSNIRLSAGTTSNLRSDFTFGNANGVSFGLDNGTITASHNGLTSQSNQAVSGQNGSFTFQTVSFSNANGISFGTSAGPAITASHNGLTSQSNQALSGSNGSFAFQTATFGNLNGFSFYTSNGSMVGSYTVPTQSNQTLGLYAVGNTTGQSTSSTFDARTISFVGQGIASVGFSNGSVNISVPAGAPSPVNFSAGTTSGDLGSVVFSNSNGVSFGLNGSTITASVAAGGGGGATHSFFAPLDEGERVPVTHGNGSLHLRPLIFPNLTFDRALFPINLSNTTNSSGSATVSVWLGIYSKNASSLSLVASASRTAALTMSGTAGSYSLFSGMRVLTIGFSTSVPQGDYWLGVVSRTTTAAANMSISGFGRSNLNSNFLGHFGSSHNTTYQGRLGYGYYTATTSGMPGSIAFSQIRGSDSMHYRDPFVNFHNGTV